MTILSSGTRYQFTWLPITIYFPFEIEARYTGVAQTASELASDN